ncbi:MAG TPA: Ig-like domain-containing protein, partial [Kofleriaceae bacterium]|nr:Ig-like domain-containing protein [Kofleriaceae bacterium]
MRTTFVAVLSLSLTLQLSCGGKNKHNASGDGTATPGGDALLQDTDVAEGLTFRLGEGRQHADTPPPRPLTSGTPLSAADTARVLARVPALTASKDDQQAFRLRDKSPPPPRTGKTIKTAFPPAPGSATAPRPVVRGGALTVERIAPQGEVPLAPHFSVTFSQPMIAVTSHADAVATGVPVTLSPQPKGTWRWVGTRTLLFDPEVRFPQATTYTATIAAGTRSATGAVLAAAKSIQFTTPPPQLQESFPSGGIHGLTPVMFARFDQRIDPAAVLATISLHAGATRIGVHAATEAEIDADDDVRGMVARAVKEEHGERYLAFVPDRALPKDSAITVDVGPGTPSREGPLETTTTQSFKFRTYGPLKVVRARCWQPTCPPGETWNIEFSNQLDDDAFDGDSIQISPALPGRRLMVQGSWIYIGGRATGNTTYEVTLPAALRDVYGQTLAKDEKLTFKVGPAQAALMGPSGLVVLDPAARRPTIEVFTLGVDQLNVQLYSVDPRADWSSFVAWRNDWDGSRTVPPGKRVANTKVTPKGDRETLSETAIDLSPAITGDHGHVVVSVELPAGKGRRHPQYLKAWVQRTKLGLDAFVDQSELVAWVTDLGTGKPVENVKLEVLPYGTRRGTDAKGVARIPLQTKRQKGPNVLLAIRGGDVAFLPENEHDGDGYGGWSRHQRGHAISWFVFDDRQMYRPGEKIHLKGWMRRVDWGEGGDVGALAGAVDTVRYKLVGPRGNDLAKGTARVSALGGFDLAIELPKTPNLGHAQVQLEAVGPGKLEGRQHWHGFQIQEFRRPEFEVRARANKGPHIVGGHAEITASANYYAGGPLTGAPVHWSVSAAPASFQPPNRDDFVFGAFIPWWRYIEPPGAHTSESYTARTDSSGAHVLDVELVSVKPPRPMQLTAQASVTDVNRQQWGATASIVIHPSELYVGLRSQRMFVDRGTPIDIASIVVDHDGRAVTGRTVKVRAVRLDWKYEKGAYVTVEKDPQSCTLTSTGDPLGCSFRTPEGGQYRITAVVADDRGRPNQTELSVWVAGGSRPPAREVEQEEVTLIPDKKSYQPGDTAEVLVQAPFYPAEALVTLRRSGITSVTRLTMNGPTTTVRVPITERQIPNVHVQVDLVGAATRIDDQGAPNSALPKRPAFAMGAIDLPVPPLSRTLAVEVTPRAREIEPGGTTELALRVTDASGAPRAGAELAVVIVDEAVLALSNYQMGDIIGAFYSARGTDTADHHLRANVRLARPDRDALGHTGGDRDADGVADDDDFSGAPQPAPPGEPEMMREYRGAKSASTSSGAGAQPIAVRSNFDPLAVFAPEVRTDAQGRAAIPVKLPDNLTRYRVMVVAVAGGAEFGKGESAITARMPLMLRPSPPRFLNFGDRFELPIVLQNQTGNAMQVDLAVRATNAEVSATGKRVTIPANDRVEVRFEAAAEIPGTARFQIAAAGGKHGDAAEVSLPVWTPATTEAFATYGEIDKGAISQPVAMPGKVVEQFGGLQISTSSTQLQALTDALLYLVAYPYECSEQLASRVLAVAALRDVLTAFEAEGLPPPAQIEAAVARDLERLAALQNWDGGFSFWRKGDISWPYVSIHVAHALHRASAGGYKVPPAMLDGSKRYLREVEQHIPGSYPDEVRRTLIAYALYVRKHLNDGDPARARTLLDEGGGLKDRSLEAIGWIYAALAGDSGSGTQLARIRKHLDNRATETASTAAFATAYSDGAHLLLHSSRRTDGILLEALIEDQPKSSLIPKLVRGLLAHRTRGHWSNTQENAFILLAIHRYFQEYEKVTPDFVARAWLGDGLAGEHEFRGRSTDTKEIEVPMSYLAKAGSL